jgi:hypothetical protein
MPVAGAAQDGLTSPSEAVLRGILALLVEEREARLKVSETKDARKIELLLADAGMPTNEIAAVTGKKPDAVRMAIKRQQAE